MNRSERMIEAANKAQEEYMQKELNEKTGEDYSNWSIAEIVEEMKRLAKKIKDHC